MDIPRFFSLASTRYCGIGAFHPEVGLIVASGWGSKVVTRSTDYGVTFERLADAPVQLDANQAALTIADEDSIFLGPGTNRQADPQENGEFYKFSLSANTWTKMATFPKDYYMAECTLWQRAPDFEKEIYCLGSRDQHLMIYNVARDIFNRHSVFRMMFRAKLKKNFSTRVLQVQTILHVIRYN